jgi:hypothetical protein
MDASNREFRPSPMRTVARPRKSSRKRRPFLNLLARSILRPIGVITFMVAGVLGLASMAMLLSLDYDVDVGGGVTWANYGVRTGIGMGLGALTIAFCCAGSWFWKQAKLIDHRFQLPGR